MGHSYSDFATYTNDFCGWEHPHPAHENGRMYHENTCPGYEQDKARNYSGQQFRENHFTSRPDFFVCPDCSAMVSNREIHDTFHDKMDRAGVIPVLGVLD